MRSATASALPTARGKNERRTGQRGSGHESISTVYTSVARWGTSARHRFRRACACGRTAYRLHRAETGIFAQVGKDMNDGFQMYLEEHGNKLGGLDVKFRAGRRPGKAGPRRDQGKKLVLNDNRLSTRTGKHRTQNHLHPIDSGGGRPHATPGRQISLPDPHWLVSIAAPPCAWSLGLRSGLQENRHDRCRLCLRL